MVAVAAEVEGPAHRPATLRQTPAYTVVQQTGWLWGVGVFRISANVGSDGMENGEDAGENFQVYTYAVVAA